MRLCRFDEGRLGVVEGTNLRDVSAALDVLPSVKYPLPISDPLIEYLPRVLARARALAPVAPLVPLSAVTLLSPVASPRKLIAAPVNYQKHLDEVRGDAAIHHNTVGHTVTIQTAGLFLKATSALVGPGEGISIRLPERRTDHEVELAVVIGRTGQNIPKAEALSYVAGYCIGLDITLRGTEDRSFRKSCDSYAVLGPWMVTADEIPSPGELDVELLVNGECRQRSNTRYLILGVPELIELASTFYTLNPGDIIFTGTPDGVSPIEAGDELVATIERIGTMQIRVHADQASRVMASRAAAVGGASS